MLPTNLAAFNTAAQNERSKLKAGEKKDFCVIMDTAAGEPVKFAYLVPLGEDLLLRGNQVVAATVTIGKERFVSASALQPFGQADFNKVVATLGVKGVTYADHKIAVEVLNAIKGIDPQFSTVVDLLDDIARSPAGTVILVANEGDQKYKVWNLENPKSEEYPKQASLRGLKHTVWVAFKTASGTEYVLTFIDLKEPPSVKVGQGLAQGAKVGVFKDTSTRGSSWELWKVSGANQRFLRNGALRVFPLTAGQ